MHQLRRLCKRVPDRLPQNRLFPQSSVMSEKNHRVLRNDVLLVVSLLLICTIGLIYLFVFRKTGDTVTVTIDGKTHGVYTLSQNSTHDIYTGANQYNQLVIQDGKAFVQTANCPDGICAAHSPIFRQGESIVCLPHGVVITITTNTTDAPDMVV